MIETTEAIVLHARKYGDTSKIISLYTLSDGLISVIAKGSRLPKNKFGSSVEPLSHSQVSYYKKPDRDLFLLSKAELVKNFKKIFDSSEKLNTAIAILESVSLTQLHHESNSHLFNLLVLFLNSLNESSSNEYNFFLKFQIELARLTGFEFDFSFLVYRSDLDSVLFSYDTGEFCNRSQGKNYIRLNGEIARYLLNINHSPLDRLDSIAEHQNNIKMINSMLCRYFAYHLDKNFHYRTFDTY